MKRKINLLGVLLFAAALTIAFGVQSAEAANDPTYVMYVVDNESTNTVTASGDGKSTDTLNFDLDVGTASGAEVGSAILVHEVRVHLSTTGGAGNLTTTLDSRMGSVFDVVFDTEDMTALSSYVYQPTVPILVQGGDSLEFDWPNANGVSWGLSIVYSRR